MSPITDGWYANPAEFMNRYEGGKLVQTAVHNARVDMQLNEAGNWSISIEKASDARTVYTLHIEAWDYDSHMEVRWDK